MAETRLHKLVDVPVAQGNGPFFEGRAEARLAMAAGLTQFGVNHVVLAPGSRTASRHWHEAEDECVYVLSGELVLIDDNGEHMLVPGDFVGFPAGIENGHHILNRSSAPAVCLVIGARKPGQETIHYPDDDFGPVRK